MELQERALYILEAKLGPTHFKVARVLHDLAQIVFRLGDFNRAEQLHKRSLEIRYSLLNTR